MHSLFKTSTPGEIKVKREPIPTSHVRFSKQQYLKLLKDKEMTGKSIPWLLKTVYFKKEISTPSLDSETRKAVRRELAGIGNNLNQLTRKVHTRIFGDLQEELLEALQSIKTLRSFLGQNYGDR
jgi:hypothetical protein